MLTVSLPLRQRWCCLQLQPSQERDPQPISSADPVLPAAIGRIRWRLLHLAEHPVPRLNGPLKKGSGHQSTRLVKILIVLIKVE